MIICLAVLIAVALGAFTWRRMLRYLRYFQQEEYDNLRFLLWWWRMRAFDRKGSLLAACGAAAAWALPTVAGMVATAAAAAGLIILASIEEDPRKSGKIKLNLTERARRIFRMGLILSIVLLCLCFAVAFAKGSTWPGSAVVFWAGAVVLLQLTPFVLMGAVALLAQGESRRQEVFLQEARAKFSSVAPYVVGITGSYGKTSTKNFLGEMLAAKAPTFWPPKSINTPMGITREIRERLRADHRFAVMEMGAYQRGSIRRLCDLTPPNAALITCVGIMHLERYGTEENIYLAKSELAQAVPSDGLLVCNADDLGSLRMAREHPKDRVRLYGLSAPDGTIVHCRGSDIQSLPEGTRFTIHWQGRSYECFAPIHGRTMVANVLGAFTVAAELGVEPDVLVAVIRTLKPVDNRLQVGREGDVTIVRDAYNSNPVGFRAALDIVRELPGGRRILMTPGMVELGPRQAGENYSVGLYAAVICDIVIVVGPTNRDALISGLGAGGLKGESVHAVENRAAAFASLRALSRPGDVILIENDLPDLYESPPVF